MRITDTHIYFWGGPFSQWFRAEFEVDGVTYCTAEQYMMAEKAKLFGDEEIRQQILKTRNARTQKQLGRKVANFDKDIWDQRCMEIVVEGNYNKFTQNTNLLALLMDHVNRTVVEASPFDKIWGIGLAPDDDRVLDESKWLGENRLGKCLNLVIDRIQNTK